MNPLSKALLSLPDPVFRLLFGKPEERDGQTLDKSAQLIVKLMRAWPSIGLDGTHTPEAAPSVISDDDDGARSYASRCRR